MSGTEMHTVRSFEDELNQLSDIILRMGGMAEAQLTAAVQALVRRDSPAATGIIVADHRIDALEQDIHALAVRILALRQPMADDLRAIVSALKISADLERIGDYAANVAKRVLVINQLPPVPALASIPLMGRLVQEIIKEVLDAYVERDVDKALGVWHRDQEVDELHTSMFRELVSLMMEDPRNITACTHLMFVAKNIERIGDHATNIAETVHFLTVGRVLPMARPKGDQTGEFIAPVQSSGSSRDT
ncbi:phosphate signaling complex protein PhoU [Haematospirillum sp. 15-248]|uniref:phosphate signaling complex protein PhoU n=1 Tax=Haematospirillum sp. 15-248 TaxID=2723107 RepID=UPI0014399979|nr:phosphate signaling complex protein PhoU [Haematospirillum sp. 15-248]NKD88635.1 phosphate signaling complex protein PhoU [Haematospirillum sp. 15-248]